MTQQTVLEIWTDGACKGNPGPGGWGVLMRFGAHSHELYGGEAQTTNNRMELTAVIEALSAVKRPVPIVLHLDSSYVRNGITGWIHGWKKKGWVKSDKKPALNPDLWDVLLALVQTHEVHYHWVKGHADNVYNNRCDAMAVAEWQKLK